MRELTLSGRQISTHAGDVIIACDAGIGHYDVDALVRRILFRGFEDCELLGPDADIAF